MRRILCLTFAFGLCATVAHAQTPVLITNAQAVDYTSDATLTLASTSGPVQMCRTSNGKPTAASGDTQTFTLVCSLYGAARVAQTDNNGNDLTLGTKDFYITTASTNSRVVKAAAGGIRMIHATNTTASWAYLRTYNQTTAPTCSSATNFIESIPIPPNGVNGRALPFAEPFTTGLSYCVTGGGSSTDNTNAVAGVYITIDVTP